MSYNEFMNIYKKVTNHRNDLIKQWTEEALKTVDNKLHN